MKDLLKIENPRTDIMATHIKYPFRKFTIPMCLIATQLVREHFEPEREYMEKLKEDMVAKGQLEPIMVRNEGDHYWLKDGAHRFFAARELDWDEIDVFIVKRERGKFIEGGIPIKLSDSIYNDHLEEREDEPWRALSYVAEINTIMGSIMKERGGKRVIYQPIASLLPEPLNGFKVSRVDSPERLAYILPRLIGQTVLDVGCSEGYFACEIAKRGYQVTAIDRSPHMVDVVRALAVLNGLSVKCETGNWEDFFEREVYYDNVLLLSIFHHTIEERGDQAFEALSKIRGKATRVFMETEWFFTDMSLEDGAKMAHQALNMAIREISHPGWRDIILYERVNGGQT